MQRFRSTVPVLLLQLLTLAGVSIAHARKRSNRKIRPWVKQCQKANAVTKDKDGNDERKVVNIILTHHDRQNGNSGRVSAAECQIDGQDKLHFMIMAPLDMQIRPISGSWR
jgi:hypothetical protein